MLTAQGHIPTDRAGRYLAQLCRHVSRMPGIAGRRPRAHADGEAPPQIRQVEWSETRGVIDFGVGTCTLAAGPDGLTVHAQAPDEQHLRRVRDGITARIEKIGRRDGLRVTWDSPPAPATAPEDNRGAPDGPTTTRSALRSHGTAAGVAVLALGAAAVHLGAGRALLESSGSGWTLAAVAGFLVAKGIVIGTVVSRRRGPARGRR